ncbi:MAG TPA: helix-turn-helix domain-containing protein [Ktedonobacteraceae bacterium]|nr:helix-turn-helix domain-containing protein [Ktedonobacteraceae bacterium]
MNYSTHTSSDNPFTRSASVDASAFYGRQHEVQNISHKLRTQNFSCSVIGETHIGKTSLLRRFTDSDDSLKKEFGLQDILFVYFDASPYADQAEGDRISVQFWWDMHRALQLRINQLTTSRDGEAEPYPPMLEPEDDPVDVALVEKNKLEKLLRDQKKRIVFALDNLEGVASLPVRDSVWLRSLSRYCSYLATSRYPIRLLYHPERKYSPFWNSFLPESVYLSLMAANEVNDFIYQSGKLADFWHKQDIDFVKENAGRHPAFLRLICDMAYQQRAELSRQQVFRALNNSEIEVLEVNFYREASIICNQLWHGLEDPELRGISRLLGYQKEPGMLSPHQQALMEVVYCGKAEDMKRLLELEQRGLIERKDGKWQVFAEVMHQFLLNLAQIQGWTDFHPAQSAQTLQSQPSSPNNTPPTVTVPQEDEKLQEKEQPVKSASMPAFTYLEGEVYHYLQAHTNQVCSKNDIKQAIWKNKLPTDSTLQKLIERIREKIETDPDNPRYLIAVRGQGYILRSDQPQGSPR